MLMQLKFRFRN